MLKYEKNGSPNKGLRYTLFVFAIIFLIILLIINISPIKSFSSKVVDIIAPIILGAAIAYLLNPILKFLEFIVFKNIKNKKIVRFLSLVLTYVYAILIITLVISVLLPRLTESITDLVKNYKLYISTTLDSINSFISGISLNFENFDTTNLNEFINEFFNESGDIFKTVTDSIILYGKSLITILKNFVLGLFISVYILISKERLYAQSTKAARAFLPNKTFQTCMRYIRIANSTFGRFFVGKLFDSAIIFVITIATLAILNIPHALIISVTIAVLNIIPFFGMIVAIVFTSFLVFIAAPDKFIAYVIIMIIIEQIDANIIAPKILGNSAGISSLGVIIAVIIMGAYFGIVGMIIGVPIFAIVIAVCKDMIDKKLASKKLPIETKDYYTDPEYSTDSENNKPIARVIFDPILNKISGILNSKITNNLKNQENAEESNDDDFDESSD